MFTVMLESETWPPVFVSETPFASIALMDADSAMAACEVLRIAGVLVIRQGDEVLAKFKTYHQELTGGVNSNAVKHSDRSSK